MDGDDRGERGALGGGGDEEEAEVRGGWSNLTRPPPLPPGEAEDLAPTPPPPMPAAAAGEAFSLMRSSAQMSVWDAAAPDAARVCCAAGLRLIAPDLYNEM